MVQVRTICDDRIFNKQYMISISKNHEIRQLIVDHTPWMDETTPLKIRALAIYHNYTAETFPKCVVCQRPVTYNKAYQNAFSDYCSSRCSRSHKHRLNYTTYQKLNDRQWLYDQRINNKKSYEQIAAELECSIGPVKKACIDHSIPLVKHNSSQPTVLYKLQDRDQLYQMHCIERKTVEQIAEQIQSSPATVSRWLQYHEIIRNNANSYPRKFVKISRGHQQVTDFCKSIVGDDNVEINNRTILGGDELDIVIRTKNIAIEYNGVFHHRFRPECHNANLRKDTYYHVSKTDRCKQAGLRLIHIFSDDWTYSNEIWKSILTNVLGGNQQKYFARKLEIRQCSKQEKTQFLNSNHLQRNDKSSIYFGLYNDDHLVCLISFCKSRYNSNYKWELSRFCVELNSICVGGFSRLLKHFQKQHDGDIISYADYSRSNGNVYLTNGFDLIRQNRPSYSYFNPSLSEKRLHRSNFTKTKLNIDQQTTEKQYMEQIGYHRIYDCGTLVFVKKSIL